jgi:hypothetical protein
MRRIIDRGWIVGGLETTACCEDGCDNTGWIAHRPRRATRDPRGNPRPADLVTRSRFRDLFWGGDQKVAVMMSLLRDEVLGRDRLEPAFASSPARRASRYRSREQRLATSLTARA